MAGLVQACPGHPRLLAQSPQKKTWMPATSAGMTQPFPDASLLGRDGLRPVFELLIFPEVVRRLEATPEHEIDLVEVEIDHRSDVQRQELGYEQAADHRDTERLAQLRAGA